MQPGHEFMTRTWTSCWLDSLFTRTETICDQLIKLHLQVNLFHLSVLEKYEISKNTDVFRRERADYLSFRPQSARMRS